MDAFYKSELNEYISQCKARLGSVLQGLGWTEVATLKDYNGNSIATSTRPDLKKHCSTFKATFPDSCVTKNSVVLDTQKLQVLLENNELKAPDNFNELQGNFSREQKLKLYEHAIDNTSKLENNLLDNDAEGEISLADILAQKKREEKRKKRRYRKSKPTHIEEVQCLVNLQMQALEQFLSNKIKKVEDTTLQRSSNQDDWAKEIYQEKRPLKDYGRKEHRKIYTEHNEIKISHRSLIKEPICHNRRKREFDSHDKVRRRRSISSNLDIPKEGKKHGSKRKKSKERRKHSRRDRSHSKKASKEKKYRRRSRSHGERRTSQSNYEREDSKYQKYSSRRELASYSKYSKDNHTYYRNQSSSPESYREKHKTRVKSKDDN